MYIYTSLNKTGDIRWDTYQAKPPFWRSGNGDETISWMVSNLNWLKSRKKLSCSSSRCACVRTADQNMPRSSKIMWCVKMIPSVRQKKTHGTIFLHPPDSPSCCIPNFAKALPQEGIPKDEERAIRRWHIQACPVTSHQPPATSPPANAAKAVLRQLRQLRDS